MSILNFNGFIRDIIYTPCLIPKLETYGIDNFKINCAKSSGIITLGSLQNNLAFSQWSSPKRREHIHLLEYTILITSILRKLQLFL